MKKFPSCILHLPKDTFSSYIQDWYMPTNGSADIFSTLVDPSCISSAYTTYPRVDYFPVSPHAPRTGNNFAGIAINEWYREYLGIKLITPLVPGEVYCCEMYVSFNPGSRLVHQCLSMYLSENKIEGDDYSMLYAEPQITADSAIKDSVNWVRIGTSFKATKADNYLTIGNFCTNGAMQIEPIGTQLPNKYLGTYYFIDDISVKRLEYTKPIISGNKPVCIGDTLKLSASGWDNMSWFYYGDPYNSINNGKSEITINANPQKKKLLVTGTICDWPVSDTISIQLLLTPKFNLGNDTIICNGSSIQLDPGSGLTNFKWQDGSTTSTFIASNEGVYKLNAANADGCFNQDSIRIGFYLNPKVNLGENIEQCTPLGTFDATSKQKEDKYLWQDHSTSPQFHYNREGEYYVTVENPCGIKAHDSVFVHKIQLSIPNLITPNFDNLNDKLIITGAIEGKGHLSVYNRNGVKVYDNINYKNNWPEKDLPDGLYYYLYFYPTCEDKKGWIQLIK